MSDEDPAKGFAKLLAGWGISGRSPPRARSPERMMRKRIRIFTEAKTFYYVVSTVSLFEGCSYHNFDSDITRLDVYRGDDRENSYGEPSLDPVTRRAVHSKENILGHHNAANTCLSVSLIIQLSVAVRNSPVNPKKIT